MNQSANAVSIENTADRPLFNRLTAWFSANDWYYEENDADEGSYLTSWFSCEKGTWQMVAHASEMQRHVYFWTRLDMYVPEDRRSAVAEFITRANFDRRIGCFELDFNDGEIRCRVTLWVPDGDLKDAQIDEAVERVIYDMIFYFPALMSVIHEGKDPAETVTKVLEQEMARTCNDSIPDTGFVEKGVLLHTSALLH